MDPFKTYETYVGTQRFWSRKMAPRTTLDDEKRKKSLAPP
jgi:hypothetical protein